MPVHIKRLRCRVTVKTGGRETPVTHYPGGARRPSMQFALPVPEPRTEATQPEPAQTVTEHPQAIAEPKATADVKRADPRAVADRVYDLMKQEIAVSRQRAGSRRTG